ncbi:transglutaminase domain-containing protein [Thermococcus sp. 18S1]|uniref:transglutaminase domain-containing protein n=1 Tax=Thermococcus sp. 18S1 TaxID=1638210 RepID=UPI00143880E7|nr:transglutaminase domain-containing protein [Thermococcus sp. 18S1]
MRKYISSALILLLTLLLIASINQIPQRLYGTPEGAPAGNGSAIAGIESILGIKSPEQPVERSVVKNGTLDLSRFYPWLNSSSRGASPRNVSFNLSKEYDNMSYPFNSSGTSILTEPESIDLQRNGFCRGDTKRVIMTVRGAAHTSYLRGGVYVTYLNGTWYRLNETPITGNRGVLPLLTVEHTNVSDNITVVLASPIVEDNLLTALYTEEVNAPGGLKYYPESHLFGTSGVVWNYSFKTVHYIFPDALLKGAKTTASTRYLQTPNVSERVLELARNITAGIEGDYLKARAIESYLRTHYEFDMNAPPAPEGIDPLEWFLFHSKRGVCIDFNTAFVVLARLNGIPARLVTGYLIKETPAEQAVHPIQAHAWAEVPFEGIGWVTFDATAPAGGLLGQGNETAGVGESQKPENQSLPGPDFDILIKPDPVITDVNRSFQVYVTVIPHGLGEVNGCKPELSVKISMDELYSVSSTIAPNITKPFRMSGIPEPGTYHPTVKVTLSYCGTVSGTKSKTFTVIVRGGKFSLTAEPENLTLVTGELGRLKIYVTGEGYSGKVNLNVEYPGRYRLLKESGIPDFESDLLLTAPPRPGDYSIKITGTSGDTAVVLQVPLRVLGRTRTRITGYPAEILKDRPFWVNGTVTDENGGPVDGPVYVTLNESKDSPGVVVGRGTSVNGRFSVECSAPPDLPPGNYQIVAHFGGNDYYLPSNSDPEVIVRDRTAIQVEGPMVTKTGKFELGGKLVDSAGNGVPNATIGVSLDGTFHINVTTDSAGVFTAPLLLETPGEHRVMISYRGSRYYLDAEAAVNITAVELNATVPDRWIIGRNVTINGSILGVDSGSVSLSTPMGRFTSVLKEGRFNFTVPVNVSPGIYNVFFAYEDVLLENIPVTIASPTNITVEFGEMREGENTTIAVRLVDAFGNPVPGRIVTLNLFGNHSARTDMNGTARFTVRPGESGRHRASAVFEGDEFYLPSTAEFEVSVAGRPPYTLILAGLIILPVGVLVYRRREDIAALKIGIASALRGLEKRRYSQILHPDRRPPVYGEGEKITVTSDVPVELFVDGKPAGTGNRFELVLPLGVHELLAKGEKVRGWLKVWVVDYREEIMRLYDRCFLELARRKGLGGKDLAPEELAHRLRGEYDWNDLKTVTYLFEVARYSLYPVGKREFMEFYRSLSRLVGGDCYEED